MIVLKKIGIALAIALVSVVLPFAYYIALAKIGLAEHRIALFIGNWIVTAAVLAFFVAVPWYLIDCFARGIFKKLLYGLLAGFSVFVLFGLICVWFALEEMALAHFLILCLLAVICGAIHFLTNGSVQKLLYGVFACCLAIAALSAFAGEKGTEAGVLLPVLLAVFAVAMKAIRSVPKHEKQGRKPERQEPELVKQEVNVKKQDLEHDKKGPEQSDMPTRLGKVSGYHIYGLSANQWLRVRVELYQDRLVLIGAGRVLAEIPGQRLVSVSSQERDRIIGSKTRRRERTSLASTVAAMNGDWGAAWFFRPRAEEYQTENQIKKEYYLVLETDDEIIVLRVYWWISLFWFVGRCNQQFGL